ncbi:MAG: hypothetical protein IJ068_06810 [Bacilli bacterium]|nr:hypothetical protein [Bacilli bacterium]
MKYEAIESFSGIVSMTVGEVREIPNDALAKDLIKAKLIKKYVANDAKVIKEELEKANKTIEELTLENTELKAELENLKTRPVDADKEENAEEDEEETTGEDAELKTNKK